MATHQATSSSLPAGAVSAQTSPYAPGYVEIAYQNISHYAKFLVPLISAALITYKQVDGHGNGLFVGLSILIAVLAALGTWGLAAHEKWYLSLKFWVNVLAVIAQGVLAIVGTDGSLTTLTPQDWTTIGLAAISALGVVIIPNGPKISQQVISSNTNGVYDVSSLPPLADPLPAPSVISSTDPATLGSLPAPPQASA